MINLFYLTFRSNIDSWLSRPGNLFLSTLGTLINNSLYMYGIYIIASLGLKKYTAEMNIFFITTGLITTAWGLINLFSGGLIELGKLIENGELESYLSTPKHPILLAAFSKCEISGLAEIIQGLLIIGYLGLNVSLIFAIKMLLAVLVTATALLALVIMSSTLSFFLLRGYSISTLFIQLMLSMSLFPIGTVLKTSEKWILYLSPVLFSSFLPVKSVLTSNILWFILSLLGATLFLLSSISFFNIGLKSYKAANFIKIKS